MKHLFSIAIVLAMALVSRAQTIGIQLYSLRDQFPKDVPAKLALVKSWGITGVRPSEREKRQVDFLSM